MALLALAVIVCAVAIPKMMKGERSFFQSESYAELRPSQDSAFKNRFGTEAGPLLVIFMDFQCPACREELPQVRSLVTKHPAWKLQIVNFPLDGHRLAIPAARLAEQSRLLGKYDVAVETLLAKPIQESLPELRNLVRKWSTGLSQDVLTSATAQVESDGKLCNELALFQTPTFVIWKDRKPLMILDEAELKRRIS
jgi:hypothetical protein